MKKEEKVLVKCLELLDSVNADAIVLSGRSFREIDFTGDVDISVSQVGWKSLDVVISKLISDQNLVVLQDIWHGYHKRAFVLHTKQISNVFWVQLDFMIDFSVKSHPNVFSRQAFLSNSFLSDPICRYLRDEFYQEYWFVRRILKSDFISKKIPNDFKPFGLRKIKVGIKKSRVFPVYMVSRRILLFNYIYELCRLLYRGLYPTGIYVTGAEGYREFLSNNYYCSYELNDFSMKSIMSSVITVRKKGCVFASSSLVAKSWLLRVLVIDFRDSKSVLRRLKLKL